MSTQVTTAVTTTTALSLSDYASIATVGACILGIISIIFLIIQLRLARKALCAQVSATEAEVYTSLNIEFFKIVSAFRSEPNINKPTTKLSDLKKSEIRTIDKYFYLANTEYNLIIQGTISSKVFKSHWISGIRSSAQKRPFAERWQSLASSFSFSDEFKDEYNSAIQEHLNNGNLYMR